MNWKDYIVADPEVLAGKPVIKNSAKCKFLPTLYYQLPMSNAQCPITSYHLINCAS